MKISVIIPTYNRADLISETVQGFMQQDCMDFELIIVDDGSTDHTEEVISGFKSERIRYFHIPNSERGAARNFGASKATGTYLNFFDSDDIALPNHIAAAINIIHTHANIPAFQLHVANRFGNETKPIKAPAVSLINNKILKGQYCFPNGVFIKKNVFQQYKYNESRKLSGTEDWELYLRMIAYVDISFYPVVTSVYLNHSERSVLQFNEEKLFGRYEALIDGIIGSEAFMKKYHGQVKLVRSRMLSYIALHAVLDQKKKIACKYLKKSLATRIQELFSLRTWVVVKRLIF
jgi:glycosyltransferase involved in cell wall biosynthesis